SIQNDWNIKMNQRFYLCYLIHFLAFSLGAQPFPSAPVLAKKVKKIIEWTRTDFEQTSQRGFTSEFDFNGNLRAYYHASQSPKEGLLQKFDAKGQLLTRVEGQSINRMEQKFDYGLDKISIVKTFRGKVAQSHQFFDQGGRLVEEKTYLKGGELGEQFILKDRTLYHYQGDSLGGKTHYNYALKGKERGIAYQKRKTTYEYHPQLRHRTRKVEYDFDGQMLQDSEYLYDKKGRLKFLLEYFPRENNKRLVEYKYKAGKIWQIIDQIDQKKLVNVYYDGRLIRLRSYFSDQIFSIVDYQYIYYD
ncbi:MAG: hypothetical protein AAF985_25935, partial [Bacteroidota bacterium]